MEKLARIHYAVDALDEFNRPIYKAPFSVLVFQKLKDTERKIKTSSKPISTALGSKKQRIALEKEIERESGTEKKESTHTRRAVSIPVSYIPPAGKFLDLLKLHVPRQQRVASFIYNLNTKLVLSHGVALFSPAAVYAFAELRWNQGKEAFEMDSIKQPLSEQGGIVLSTETKAGDAFLVGLTRESFLAAVRSVVSNMESLDPRISCEVLAADCKGVFL